MSNKLNYDSIESSMYTYNKFACDINGDYTFEKPDKTEFSYYLLSMREYLGVSKEDFSKSLNINPRTYYSYESGRSIPGNWSEILGKIQSLVKIKSAKIRDKEDFNSVLNSSLEAEILLLHDEGKNIVQIGIELSLSEELVEKYLLSKGLNPLYSNLNI